MNRVIWAALLFAASPAFAQGETRAPDAPGAEPNAVIMGRPWTVVLSLQRALAFGPYFQDGPSGHGGMSVGLGPYLRSTDVGTASPFLPHLAPRLVADLMLGEHVSVGAGAGYGISVAGFDDPSGVLKDTEWTTKTAIILGRLGYFYLLRPDNKAAMWTRIGPSYAFGSSPRGADQYGSGKGEAAMTLVAVDIDLGFVFPVARHFAITFDLAAMIGLYGTYEGPYVGSLGSSPEDGEVRRVHDGVVISLGALAFL